MTIGASVLAIALGAILLFAVTAGLAGVSLNVIGWILIVAGAVELLIALVTGRARRAGLAAPGHEVADGPLGLARYKTTY